ncbi:MAG: MBL fold metallo-hydrolase [Dehalococcoidales bacterium]|nr:MBL fold metallo-hydrolase [Dehalococcoidales bacterium]
MQIKITFLGAAHNVTGSKYLLEANNKRLLIDCGLFQERQFRARNWEPFVVPPASIDALLLTHAHLDHCGYIPKLAREGFHGPVYCTAATAEIGRITLLDTAGIQEEDAAFKKKRHEKEGRQVPYPEIPLYTIDDAKASFPLLSPVRYGDVVKLGEGLETTFHDAGHVLGSSMIRLKIKQNNEERVLVFSGDVGRHGKPILREPTTFEEADYVVVESTYGDRLLEPLDKTGEQFADVINNTVQLGGNIVIPSFALERTQEVMYYLNHLQGEKKIPNLIVFIDSPMAISLTEVFKHHPELFDKDMTELLLRGKSPFDCPCMHLTRTVDESKAINNIKGSVIIISGSGMATGGRIKHHLVNNISRPDSTILFVGYQAADTLGRQIVDGAKEVRILGQMYPVQAKIVYANSFSGHSDRDGLLQWLSGFKRAPKHLFVTHGEAASAENFATLVRDKKGWAVTVPEYKDSVVLD